MGFTFRKSFKLGPARVNVSKSGVGYSVGAGGFRYTKRAGSKKKDGKLTLWGFIKSCLILFLFIAVVCLAITYWKLILAILAILAAGVIGYWIYIQRQAHPPRTTDPDPDAIEAPVPESDT